MSFKAAAMPPIRAAKGTVPEGMDQVDSEEMRSVVSSGYRVSNYSLVGGNCLFSFLNKQNGQDGISS